MKTTDKTAIIFVALLLIALLAACSSGDDKEPSPPAQPTAQPTATSEPTEPPPDEVTITIGALSDLTGVASSAFEYLNASFKDLAEYFNEEILPPGVKIEILHYDSQNDPAKDLPGYEWLKEHGADLIFSAEGSAAVTMRPRVDRDEMVMFVATAGEEALVPPGYIFTASGLPEVEAYTYMKWIAENDWDYQTKGPAKIGGASWADAYSTSLFDAMKAYCKAHPDQFEWIDGYLIPFGTFTWAPEVEGLKDCDYVFPPVIMTSFVKEYRTAGYTAKMMVGGVQSAFMKAVYDAKLWDELDGSLFLQTAKWWGDEGEHINLTEELLYANHPNDAEEIKQAGSGYVAMQSWYPYFDMIARTVERVGAENFNSQALYDTAISYSLTVDGIEHVSFDETKRAGPNYFRMYRMSAEEEAVVVADPEWLPAVREP